MLSSLTKNINQGKRILCILGLPPGAALRASGSVTEIITAYDCLSQDLARRLRIFRAWH